MLLLAYIKIIIFLEIFVLYLEFEAVLFSILLCVFFNLPEIYGTIFMMDGCTFLAFKISTTIHCHYEAWKSHETFGYNV